MTDQLPGRRIYLDSNAFIYAIEGAGDSSSQLHSLFEALRRRAEPGRNLARPSFEVRGAMPKLPDAIHIVTAVQAGCTTFVSSDRNLKLPLGMARVGHEDGTLLKLVQDVS